MKIYFSIFFIFAVPVICLAQTPRDTLKTDSSRHLTEAIVRGYLTEQPVLSVPASVSVLSSAQLKLQPDNSLVSALNTIPGVRMEERSPGSYHLSIRSNSVRSPFGVRDIKIYYDDIPLTDAGGNTYLNAIDVSSVQGIEVLKGPDGSLFGANSEGVMLISPVNRYNNSNFVSAGVSGGSYGLLHENVAAQSHTANNQLNINQAFENYDGYRQNTHMDRNYLQANDKLSLSQSDQLKFLGFYSAMNYETPGGLTLAQYQTEPQLARLPTKATPGAIQQRIGVRQKMLLGGIVNEWHISDRLKNVSSLFGTYVDFANPFITTYNQRYEGTYGFRTYLELDGKQYTIVDWKVNLGTEWQQTNSDINSYSNRGGIRDTAQTLDRINTNQHFIFARFLADIDKKFHVEAALSLNFYDYEFRNIFPNNETSFTNRSFTPQLMPRIALSYQISNNFAWRVSASRGYSTPATAEIRPTDQTINTNLQAEDGWNYETGFRLRNADETMFLDASVFYYLLNNAIVPRVNGEETTYVNAGGTRQPGFELYFTDWLIRQNNVNFIRGLQVNESITLNRFTYSSYQNGTTNYSGNQLTGVPGQVLVTSMQVKLPGHLYVFAEYNYTSRIPLNDASSVYAGHYDLVQAKVGWEHLFNHKSRFGIYAGVDNLLNEKYSLGDDLNATGNRYYNAAELRNYYVGMNVTF